MKQLAYILALFAALQSCKKESTPALPKYYPPVEQVCPDQHMYGPNCDQYYGDLLTGEWEITDTMYRKVEYPVSGHNQNKHDTIISTHTCIIYDSTRLIGKDTFRWFYARGIWPSEESGPITLIPTKDDIEVAVPKYKGYYVTAGGIHLNTSNNFTYFNKEIYFQAIDQQGKAVAITTSLYLHMRKK